MALMLNDRRLSSRATPLLTLVALSLGCRATSPRPEETEVRGEPEGAVVPRGSSASRTTAVPASASAVASVAHPPWPPDAPASHACRTHADCTVVSWDAPLPPDPCCDVRVGYYALSRSYLTFMTDFRKKSCGGIRCPPAPLPGAEPACCASVGRCVAKRCVTACEDPTARVPAVRVIDPACHSFRLTPHEAEP